MKKLVCYMAIILSLSAFSAHAGWESPGIINEVYFELEGTTQKMTLVMQNQFHGCGWPQAAEFRTDYLDNDFYQTLVSAALAAKLAQAPISIFFNGCQNNRVKSYAIKIN